MHFNWRSKFNWRFIYLNISTQIANSLDSYVVELDSILFFLHTCISSVKPIPIYIQNKPAIWMFHCCCCFFPVLMNQFCQLCMQITLGKIHFLPFFSQNYNNHCQFHILSHQAQHELQKFITYISSIHKYSIFISCRLRSAFTKFSS